MSYYELPDYKGQEKYIKSTTHYVDIPSYLFTTPAIYRYIHTHDLANATAYLEEYRLLPINEETEYSEIMFAARYDDIPMIALLLFHGADINSRGPYSRTPLIEAASRGNCGVVDYLLSNGANIDDTDSSGNTALITAINVQNKYVVNLLLSRGANVHIRAKWNSTPLHIAASLPNTEIVELLLKSSASPHLIDDFNDKPIDTAVKYNQKQHLEILSHFMRPIINLPTR